MKQPIIPIPRADEKLINTLVESGILVVTEEGIKVNEKADISAQIFSDFTICLHNAGYQYTSDND